MNDVKDEKNIHLRSERKEKLLLLETMILRRPSDGYGYVFHYINRLYVQDHQFINDQNGTIHSTVNCISYITFIPGIRSHLFHVVVIASNQGDFYTNYRYIRLQFDLQLVV